MADDAKALELKITLDRSQAKDEAAAHAADMAEVVAATKRADASSIASGAKTAAARMQQSNQTATAFNRNMQSQMTSVGALGQSLQTAGGIGAAAWKGVGKEIELSRLGMDVLRSAAQAVGQAMAEAYENSRKLARSFLSDADKLRELSKVAGQQITPVDQAKFGTETGLTFDEGIGFRTEFRNAGQQYIGKKISKEEFEEAERGAGQLAAATGFDPTEVGMLGGQIVGSTDRRNLGNKAGEDVLGKLKSGLDILGAGQGRNNILIKQFKELQAATFSDDEVKGFFNDLDDVATATSLFAQSNDANASQFVQIGGRALRDFKGKLGKGGMKKLNDRAGIGPNTPYLEGIKKLAPVVQAEAKARGLTSQDVLREATGDEEVARALAIATNNADVIDQRRAVGKAAGGAEGAKKEIADFQAGRVGANRKAEAQVKLAEAQRGEENADVEVLRRQAEAKLIGQGKIDTTSALAGDFLYDKTVGWVTGSGSSRKARIDREVANMIQRRRGVGDGRPVDLPTMPEEREAFFRRGIEEIRGMGGDPMNDYVRRPRNAQGIPIAPEGIMDQGQGNKDLQKNNELLKENNDLMRGQNSRQMIGPQSTPQMVSSARTEPMRTDSRGMPIPPSRVAPGVRQAVTSSPGG